MRVEDVMAKVKKQRLFVSNLYEGADGIWRCFLRHKRNALPSIHRGQGKSMIEALTDALPIQKDFEDLLG